MSTKYPRRERKKLETRESIKAAAFKLFGRQGYEATTLENIAQEADVHLQTLYRHFDSKADLAACIERDFLQMFEARFRARTEPALDFWRGWIEAWCREVTKPGNPYRKTVQSLFGAPSMVTSYLDTWFHYQKLLAEGLAAEMKAKEDDRLPLLMAAMLWGGQLHALRTWVDSKGKSDFTRDSLEVIDTTAEHFGHLMENHIKRQARLE